MKGIICTYSGSGNTKLVCRHLIKRIPGVEFDLFDITKGGLPDLATYDIVGFATFTDLVGVPHLLHTFLRRLPKQESKPAFVLLTYGSIIGRALKSLAGMASAQGFRVLAGHALHTPESYPPMIAGRKGAEEAPSEKELTRFNAFCADLNQRLTRLQAGRPVRNRPIRLSLLNGIIPVVPRSISRRIMGDKYVDESRCIECGVCQKRCPYGAITLDPKPVFDTSKCQACWACYNHCPEKAIYTAKYRDVGHYPKPIAQFKQKLDI